jgi:hypothetical protein
MRMRGQKSQNHTHEVDFISLTSTFPTSTITRLWRLVLGSMRGKTSMVRNGKKRKKS